MYQKKNLTFQVKAPLSIKMDIELLDIPLLAIMAIRI